MKWDAAITIAGKDLLEKWAGGGTLTIERAAAGTGRVPAVTLSQSEALVSEVQQLAIISRKIVDEGMRFQLQFDAAVQAYAATQVGLWARLDDGETTLMAIYQAADDESAISVAAASEMPEFAYAFGAIVTMSNEQALQVEIASDVYVTYAALEEMKLAKNLVLQAVIPAEGWAQGDDGRWSVTVAVPEMPELKQEGDGAIIDYVRSGDAETDAARKAMWNDVIDEIETQMGSLTVYALSAPTAELPIRIKTVY